MRCHWVHLICFSPTSCGRCSRALGRPGSVQSSMQRPSAAPPTSAGACEDEIARFCGKVEPGEGRLEDCLTDQLEEEEEGDAAGGCACGAARLRCKPSAGDARGGWGGPAGRQHPTKLWAHGYTRAGWRRGQQPSSGSRAKTCCCQPTAGVPCPPPAAGHPVSDGCRQELAAFKADRASNVNKDVALAKVRLGGCWRCAGAVVQPAGRRFWAATVVRVNAAWMQVQYASK